MRIFVLLASLFNGYVIGSIVALLAKRFWGDNPKGRFAEVIGGLGSGIFYSLFCLYYWMSDSSDGSLLVAILILFGPIGLVLLVALLNYMYKK